MIKIVFEDNKDTPSSALLKCLPIGADIEFSDGNSKLAKEAMRLSRSDGVSKVIAFIDIVTDNNNLLDVYNSIVSKFNKYKKNIGCPIYLVAIPCIEYFILKYLSSIPCNLFTEEEKYKLSLIINEFDFSSCMELRYMRNKKMISYEKVLKSILYRNEFCCIHNKNMSKNNKIGLFYKEDCSDKCLMSELNCNCSEIKLNKAFHIYRCLPIVSVDGRLEQLLGVNHCSYEELSDEQLIDTIRKFYKKMYDTLGGFTFENKKVIFKGE